MPGPVSSSNSPADLPQNSAGLASGTGKVWFIGAGPGDPELLTVKGQRLIAQADLVLYAGSLVPPAVVAGAKAGAKVLDSAPLCLEETHALMRGVALGGGMVARVHTGDPGLYGAVREQARLLDADDIAWEVVPGVTAAFAAAAAAKIPLTVPDVTQSVIITRLGGRTPVPAAESLRLLAAHGSTVAVYLSAAEPEAMQRELENARPAEKSPEAWAKTPVICACRVGWPDQRIVRASIGTLAEYARQEGFTRQTVFIIAPGEDKAVQESSSCLYSATFSHGWRQAKHDPEKTGD